MHLVNNFITVISTVLIYRLIFSPLVNNDRIDERVVFRVFAWKVCSMNVVKPGSSKCCLSRACQEMQLLSLMGWQTAALTNAPQRKLSATKHMQLTSWGLEPIPDLCVPSLLQPISQQVWQFYELNVSQIYILVLFFFLNEISLLLLYFYFLTSKIKI